MKIFAVSDMHGQLEGLDPKRAEIERCAVFCLPTLSENFGIVMGQGAFRLEQERQETDGGDRWVVVSVRAADLKYYEGLIVI